MIPTATDFCSDSRFDATFTHLSRYLPSYEPVNHGTVLCTDSF